MKITNLRVWEVEASHRGNWLFVVIDTDVGIQGVGEASQSGNDELVRVCLRQLGERIEGLDPTQPEVVWERAAQASAVFSGSSGRVGATAVSAIDQAMWDIAGKAMDVPAWRLLGGRRRERVRCYANMNRGTRDRSPEGFAKVAEAAVKAGFRAVKATPFDEIRAGHQDRDGVWDDVEKGLARLRACREAIGGEVELLVDCHCRFDLPLAMRIAAAVRPLNLFWFEEPLPRDQIEANAHVTAHSGQTTAGGESFFGRAEFERYVTGRAVHILMPDVKHAGGITECRRIAHQAEIHQVHVAPHSPAGPVSTMAGVQVAATIPNFLILEWAFGEVDWRADLLRPVELVEDGYITVPDGAGLGFDLDADVVAAHAVEGSMESNT
ncbi:MAG: mandelate racemase/muconate lactonizing enzyme family protein [Gemmatimonadetes bacterium]|nr:mandelate racemase/muconate lactonizing enzyme family protein [Gemmatimonadota bacterium]MBT6143905.1 mandelate racemase/muconate lactonizing enzyme family protein [Gemmatimonadota bacterium]MBT7863749.1 mandelate racemase/muconate lactonizing enzyme family protein [Gemmatimonadota bacterium]